jgi:hypothetical protein
VSITKLVTDVEAITTRVPAVDVPESPKRKTSRKAKARPATVVEDDIERLGVIVEGLEKKAKDGDARAIDQLVRLAKERAKLSRQVSAPTTEGSDDKATKLLTVKQRRFVEALTGAANGNATEAARLAGYKGSNDVLKHRGHELRNIPHVAAAIEAKLAGDPLVTSGDDLRRFWSSVQRGETFKQRAEFGAVIDAPATLKERLLASQYLGKAHGLFIQKVEVDVGGAEIVIIKLPDNGRGDRE